MMPLTQAMLNDLRGRCVALVYAFPKVTDPPNRWYDRWKSRVIMSYGEALERLGVKPYYCDVDTFIDQASSGRLPECDAAISLNAGVRPVAHFALIPAVAQWFQIPIIPCTADVIMAGERKDLGNAIAGRAGLWVPKTYLPDDIACARNEGALIVKPRDLGGSYGLKRIDGTAITEGDFSGGKVVQQFVTGYDVTIPVFMDAATGSLAVTDATIYLPSGADPTQWIYDRDAKEAYVGGTGLPTVTRIQIPLSLCAERKIRTFSKMIGVDCFARVDFRLAVDSIEGLTCVRADQLAFIEINPMPTVCAGLAFIESIRAWAIRHVDVAAVGLELDLDDDFDVIAYVLAHALSGQLGPSKVNDRNQIGS
jgi:D-alanine-D-alanine ligase-like ATP-grasp enzyme